MISWILFFGWIQTRLAKFFSERINFVSFVSCDLRGISFIWFAIVTFEIDCGDIGGDIFCGGEMGGVSKIVYNKLTDIIHKYYKLFQFI